MNNRFRIPLYMAAALLALILHQRWQEAQQPPAPALPSLSAPVASTTNPDYIEVETDQLKLWINRKGGAVERVDLLNYSRSLKDKQPLSLLKPENPNRFMLQHGLINRANPAASVPLDAPYTSAQTQYRLGDAAELPVTLTWKNDDFTLEKTYRFKRGSFAFELEQKLDNHSAGSWEGFGFTRLVFGQPAGRGGMGQIAAYTGGVFSGPADRYEKIPLKDMNDKANRAGKEETSGWVALLQHYFLGAIVTPPDTKRLNFTNINAAGDHEIGVSGAPQTVAPGESYRFQNQIYLGPKIQDDLKALAPDLDKTVDYGFLFMLAQPMFKVLQAIHGLLGNWGWSIVLMTLLIKVLFFVPNAWGYKSMAKMRKIAPEMQRLKERFGDDRQAYAQAMGELFRREKANPARGCLPMLLQVPFFLAFYWMLAETVELRQAPWFGWIRDLSAMDPYFILPAINACLMYLTQKLNPPPTDPMQAKIMQYMPWFFGFMFMWFPAGLVLYWSVNNAFNIVQQSLMNKRYGSNTPPPTLGKQQRAIRAANDNG